VSRGPGKLYLIVVSSDVLSHNRVNVAEEKSERVIWYKVWSILCPSHKYHILSQPRQERYLTDNEIVEHVVVRPDGKAADAFV
jgi:hypothetical protein